MARIQQAVGVNQVIVMRGGLQVHHFLVVRHLLQHRGHFLVLMKMWIAQKDS